MKISKTNNMRITSLRNPTYSKGSTRVDPVSPVSPAKNVAGASLNYEFSKEHFYEKLSEHQEKNDEFEKNKQQQSNQQSAYTFTEDELEMINFLKNAFKNFNLKIDNIKNIDRLQSKNNMAIFKNEISPLSKFLGSIGILFDKFSHFYIKEDVFAKGIRTYPAKLRQLTDPSVGALKKITDALSKSCS